MFELLRTQSRSAAGAILYVTIGMLMMIWSGLWYYYFLRPDPNPPTNQSFVCVGMMMSGFVIAAIGLLFGLIGRGAKKADSTVAIAPVGTPETTLPAGGTTSGVVTTPAAVAAPVAATPVPRKTRS